MNNLIRMDLYRMRRNRAFWICLILAFVSALIQTPFAWLMVKLSGMLVEEALPFPDTALLSEIIAKPFPLFNTTLTMLSACAFFHADVESGYIKNIAGQVPKRGLTVLSKFIAVIPHNLLFMLTGVAGNLAGTVLFQRIEADAGVAEQIGIFFLRLLLLQGLCTVLLLATFTLRSKSLGSVLSVVLGTGMLFLVYLGIETGVKQLFGLEDFPMSDYMPDQMIRAAAPETVPAILSALITTGIFLLLAVRIFDRRDVK